MAKSELLVKVADAVPGEGDRPATGPVYRNVLAKDGYAKIDGIDNLFDLFCRSVKEYGDRPCLGWRPNVKGQAQAFSWLTYSEVADHATHIAGAIAKSGTGYRGRCAIFSANCPEWMITMQVRGEWQSFHVYANR